MLCFKECSDYWQLFVNSAVELVNIHFKNNLPTKVEKIAWIAANLSAVMLNFRLDGIIHALPIAKVDRFILSIKNAGGGQIFFEPIFYKYRKELEEALEQGSDLETC